MVLVPNPVLGVWVHLGTEKTTSVFSKVDNLVPDTVLHESLYVECVWPGSQGLTWNLGMTTRELTQQQPGESVVFVPVATRTSHHILGG